MTTIAVEAVVTPCGSRDNSVDVELTATDRAANGSEVESRYAGSWELEWDDERG